MGGHQLKSTLATRNFTQELQGRKPCVSCEVKTDFPTILLDLISSELFHLEHVYQAKSTHQLQAAIQPTSPPFFSVQRARHSHSKILQVCKPQSAMGPAGHSLGATHGQHLPKSAAGHSNCPHFHSGMPLVLGDDGYFVLMIPMEKQTNTHTPSDSPVTWLLLGDGKPHPASRKLPLCSGRHREQQVSYSTTGFLLSLGKVT